MGMRRGSAHGLGAHTGQLLIAGILALALLVTLGATAATAAKAATCSVTNTDSGRIYTRLTQAVDAAKPGVHLVVKGTCVGRTFIKKDLVIRGATTRRAGKAVLDGDGYPRSLTVNSGVTAEVRNLVIESPHRSHQVWDWRYGGGVRNSGTLTLRDVVVRRCLANRGSAIYNDGAIRVVGHSRLTHNLGTAIWNVGHLTLGGASRVQGNGCGVANEGTLVMDGSSNFGSNRGCGVGNSGVFTMNDSSSISDQRYAGGAPTYNSGTFVMNDSSSIHHNTAVWTGTTDFQGVIHGGKGGGIRNEGSLTMNDSSSIHDNIAEGGDGIEGRGGGIYNASGGTLVGVNCAPHTYANVYGNMPDDCYFEP